MKRRIALIAALMMVFCIALTGCGQDTGKNDANAEQVSINNLNNTYWIANSYKADDEHDSISVDGENNGIVLVFSNDRVSLIDCDGVQLKAAGYEYNNSKITFDGFNPETVYASIDGNELTLYSQNGSSWWLMTQTDIDTANAYIGQLLAGKDSFVIGEDFDTGDGGIMDGGNNTTDNSNPKYENGQYVYIVAGKEIRLSVNVWDYVKVGTKYKLLNWQGLLEHYGYTNPSTTHSQYMVLDDGSRVEVGYRVWGDGEITGVFSGSSAADTWSNIRESNPDYSDGYIFSTGEKYPGNINSLILLAYAAEQRLANPTVEPFASVFGGYATTDGSPADYTLP